MFVGEDKYCYEKHRYSHFSYGSLCPFPGFPLLQAFPSVCLVAAEKNGTSDRIDSSAINCISKTWNLQLDIERVIQPCEPVVSLNWIVLLLLACLRKKHHYSFPGGIFNNICWLWHHVLYIQYRMREATRARAPNRSGNYKFMTSLSCCSMLNHLAIFPSVSPTLEGWLMS